VLSHRLLANPGLPGLPVMSNLSCCSPRSSAFSPSGCTRRLMVPMIFLTPLSVLGVVVWIAAGARRFGA
jgi:hypothetical protein